MTTEEKYKRPNDSLVFCNVCDLTLAKKHASKHKKYCGFYELKSKIGHPFVKSGCLFAVEEILPQMPANFGSNLSWLKEHLIFLHPEAMKLCDLKLGDCTSAAMQNGPVLCVVWPSDQLPIFSVAFYAKKCKSKLSDQQNLIEIRKFPCNSLQSITLKPNSIEKSFYRQREFLEFCKLYTQGAFVQENCSLKITYFGQVCDFVCTNLHFSHVDSQSGTNLENLTENLHKIALNGECDLHDSSECANDHSLLESSFALSHLENSKAVNILAGKITDQTDIKIDILETKLTSKKKSLRFNSLGGLKVAKSRLIDHVIAPLKLISEKDDILMKNWKTRSILLFGVSGCGKNTLVEALCSEIAFDSINFDKENEDFKDFRSNWPMLQNTVIHLDENLHAKDKDSLKFTSFVCDLIDFSHSNFAKFLLVVVSTSNHERLDDRLRRRFDLDIEISTPDRSEKIEILRQILACEFSSNLNEKQLEKVIEKTHGFTAADLSTLCKEAGVKAVKRKISDSKSNGQISYDDVCSAMLNVRPSAMREIYAEVPKVHWSDIGGLDDLKMQLKQAVEWPLKHPEAFERLGIQPPSGVLMYGPPGCAKTMAAKAIATESGLNFLSIKGPELFSKWVGESERAVREVFRKARQVAPSIVFFDEIDALGAERSGAGQKSGGSQVADRVLAQLLTEMDGVQTPGVAPSRSGVLVVAATNRPDVIDQALLRPGRLDRLVYVPLPDDLARRQIFTGRLARTPLDASVDVVALAATTEGYSGAEVCRVCNEAALEALRRDIKSTVVESCDFEAALKRVKPRACPAHLQMYEKFTAGVKF